MQRTRFKTHSDDLDVCEVAPGEREDLGALEGEVVRQFVDADLQKEGRDVDLRVVP